MSTQEFLSLDVIEGGKLIFKTIDDALAWLADERQYWEWPRTGRANNPGFVGVSSFQLRDNILNKIDLARSSFQNFRSNPNDQNSLETGNAAATAYSRSGLVSSTPRVKMLDQLRSGADGDVVACAALCAFVGEQENFPSQQQQYRYKSLLGRTAMAAYDLGVSKYPTTALPETLKEFSDSNRRTLDAEREANQLALSELKATAQSVMSEQKSWKEKQTDELDTELDEFDEKKNQIIKDCEDAHARYHKWMETAAGNAYWTEEHVARKKSSVLWGRVLGGYTLAATVILILILHFSYRYAVSENAPVYAQTHLVVSGAVILAVTILFWVARFLTRMYLSERHMAIDANLRSVMVKTYLALSTDEKLREQDRALVLAPLFRAGTDGIIKEDTGMDSVLSLVARALEKPSK